MDSRLLERVFARAQEEVDSGAVDALQVAVCRAGKLAGMATFGTCPDGQKATDRTLFSIFSCTKLTVAIAMWQLLDNGKLKLTDKVADFFHARFTVINIKKACNYIRIIFPEAFFCNDMPPECQPVRPEAFSFTLVEIIKCHGRT